MQEPRSLADVTDDELLMRLAKSQRLNGLFETEDWMVFNEARERVREIAQDVLEKGDITKDAEKMRKAQVMLRITQDLIGNIRAYILSHGAALKEEAADRGILDQIKHLLEGSK